MPLQRTRRYPSARFSCCHNHGRKRALGGGARASRLSTGGTEAARRIALAARDLGLRHLTLFAFSTENWKRPESEVRGLFSLMEQFFAAEAQKLADVGIRIRAIGSMERLSASAKHVIMEAQRITAHASDTVVNVAIDYGGRWDILQAARRLATEAAQGNWIRTASTRALRLHASTAGQPDPDLVIRTGGDMRLSNFLLWQSAYSELYVTPVLWPDFTPDHLKEALAEYSRRDRRFGALSERASGGSLIARVIVGLLGAPVVLALLVAGKIPSAILCAIIAGVSALALAHIIDFRQHAAHRRHRRAVVGLRGGRRRRRGQTVPLWRPACSYPCAAGAQRSPQDAMRRTAQAAFGPLYTGFTVSRLVLIRAAGAGGRRPPVWPSQRRTLGWGWRSGGGAGVDVRYGGVLHRLPSGQAQAGPGPEP